MEGELETTRNGCRDLVAFALAVMALLWGVACGNRTGANLDPIGAGLPARTFTDFPDCTHPAVNPSCTDGSCRIPSGCFIMGSPADEWARRGAYSEDLVQVTLTHAFALQQHEVTQAQWASLGFVNTSGKMADGRGDCLESDCPAGGMNWFEAVTYANRMSEQHEPPLQPCYRLLGCTGEIGNNFTCTGFELTADSAYECEGFRLPTEAEWEYAARAGTRTAFYTGGISPVPVPGDCFEEKNLEGIAWYCKNSGGSTHPVGRKRPNGWGLFDLLGNVFEWVHDTQSGSTPPGPLVDPGGDAGQQTGRLQRGGNFFAHAGLCRAAAGSEELSWWFARIGEGVGVRLARTVK